MSMKPPYTSMAEPTTTALWPFLLDGVCVYTHGGQQGRACDRGAGVGLTASTLHLFALHVYLFHQLFPGEGAVTTVFPGILGLFGVCRVRKSKNTDRAEARANRETVYLSGSRLSSAVHPLLLL